MKRYVLPAILLYACAFGVQEKAGAQLLHVSQNGRFLQTSDGKPFLITGDAGWSILVQLTTEDATYYLENRHAKGFNLIVVELIEHKFATNAPANIYGQRPFTDSAFGTPNEAYFAHADSIITIAARNGIVVLLDAIYLGYVCGDEGWCAEVKRSSPDMMRKWGRYVGNRYKSFSNIIWLIGGDTDPTPVIDKLREVVGGIREFDTVHLMTAHNQWESFGITPWAGDPNFTLNNVYTYSKTLYLQSRIAYARTPVLPFFLIETAYENEHSSTQVQLRSQAYWTVLSGGAGQIFGNCPIWHFGSSPQWCGLTDWRGQLEAPGSIGMEYLQRLFLSRSWYTMIPDSGTIIVAGAGTYGQANVALAEHASDGSSIICYVPTSRAVSINTSSLGADSVHCWTYDAGSGAVRNLGIARSGRVDFDPPGADDWVIVADNTNFHLPAPGVPLSLVPDAGPKLPAGITLRQNYPNPFNGATFVSVTLGSTARVSLSVQDVRGRFIRRLIDTTLSPGYHEVRWDGRDERGSEVASGIYFCVLRSGGFRQTNKMVLLR